MSYSIAHERGFSDYYYCRINENPKFFPHVHSHIEFVFVLEGELDITISEVQNRLYAGQMAVIMPYVPHGYTGKSKLFVLACPPEYLSEYRQLLTSKTFNPPFVSYGQIHAAMISDIQQDGFTDNFKKKALLYYTISNLLKNSSLQDSPAFEFDVYRKALVYISENYIENITLQTTADYVGVTVSHLSRVLNQNNQPGFTDILNSLRVYAARRILEQENTRVCEAAMAAGFGSIRNFNRIFRAHFGCNPTDVKPQK